MAFLAAVIIWAVAIVAAAHPTFTSRADSIVAAVGIFGAAVFANARQVPLNTDAVLPHITLS